MSLDAEDRSYIRETATNVAAKVSERIIENVMKWHVEACPHGKTILAAKYWLIGAFAVCTLAGGVIGGLLTIVLNAR